MRSVLTALLVSVGALLTNAAIAQNAQIFTGSGVVIGTHGEILTNAHVVERCNTISVQFPSEQAQPAVLVADDQRNDLAVIRSKNPRVSVAAFREGKPLRAGDAVVALGYPLSGLLASAANVSTGNVSALAGIGDDSRHLQISAPVQPGNSGGPLLDASGHIVGIVTAKLNAVSIARSTGDIPQNVNFAIKAEVARAFLDSRDIHYRTARSDQQLSPADVGDMARPLTAYIQCQRAASAAGAYTFASPEGKFTAEFPAAPTLGKTTRKTTAGTPYDQYTWSIENKDGWWGVAMIIYSKAVMKDYDAHIRGAVAATKGTLLGQKTIQQSGAEGREILIEVPRSGVVRQRLLWIGDRFYQIVFSGRPGTGTTPNVEAFLNSFRTIK